MRLLKFLQLALSITLVRLEAINIDSRDDQIIIKIGKFSTKIGIIVTEIRKIGIPDNVNPRQNLVIIILSFLFLDVIKTNAEWIVGNFNHRGFYRVNYDTDGWKKIQNELNNNYKVCLRNTKINMKNKRAILMI